MAVSDQCIECKHYTGQQQCPAFPVGIPKRYFVGYEDHDEVVEYQFKDIVYTPAKVATKGGPGSGNWGHDGMPGVWGGGAGGGGSEEFLELSPAGRHACDPETGEFDEERFLKYTEDMTEEEYQDYLEELEEDLGELKEDVPDSPAPEPGEFKTPAQAEAWLKREYNISADFRMAPSNVADLRDPDERLPDLEELAREADMDYWEFVLEGEIPIHMEYLNENLEQFEKIAEKYPEIADRLDYIGTFNDLDRAQDNVRYETSLAKMGPEYWDDNPMTYAVTGGNGRYVGLNPAFFGNAEETKASIEQDILSGYHPGPLENEHTCVLTHELGHVLQNELRYNEANQNRYIDKYVDSGSFLEERKVSNAADIFPRKLHEHLATEENLSRYAEKNPLEAFAEAFVALEQGTGELAESPAAKSMEKFLDAAREDYYTEDKVIDVADAMDTEQELERMQELKSNYDLFVEEFIPGYTGAGGPTSATKGGPGSGNWGHDGMPGVWGGGAGGGGSEEFLELSPAGRHACDPDTGEFDKERFLEHTEDMTQEEYEEYLEELEEDLGELEQVPDKPRPQPGEFKDPHEAFGYFAREYNISTGFTVPAKYVSAEELHEYWESGDYDHFDSYEEMKEYGEFPPDMEFLNGELEELDRLLEKYPECVDGLHHVGFCTTIHEFPIHEWDAETLEKYKDYFDDPKKKNWNAFTSTYHGTIGLNPKRYANPEGYKRYIDNSIKSGYHPDNIENKYHSIMTHEFGHHLQHTLGGQASDEFNNKYLHKYTGKEGTMHHTGVNEATQDFAEGLERRLANEETISRYAEKSSAEAFAETFVAYELGTEHYDDVGAVQAMDKFLNDALDPYHEDDVIVVDEDNFDTAEEYFEAREERLEPIQEYVYAFEESQFESEEEKREAMRRRGLIGPDE